MTLFHVEFTFLFSPGSNLYYASVSEIYFYLLTKSLVAAPALLVLHVSYYDWPHDCSNQGVEEITGWLATNYLSPTAGQGILLQIKLYLSSKLKKKVRLDCITQQYIFIWAYICKTSQWVQSEYLSII